MQRKNNVVIAQSGGPSSVINNSLRGIIETCQLFPETFGKIYGAHHGIEGILKEELIDLDVQEKEEIALLRTTPAAGAIGTCRYKLKKHQQEDFERVIQVFKAHNISYFFYIGGNDSMDTANKISILAGESGLDLIAVGVPKTIDNDIGDTEFKLIDHTPGYGSVSRYWSSMIRNIDEENRGSCPADPVIVIQAMGRKIGYIPAASKLADPDREMPLQIYMAESGLTLENMADLVNDELKICGRCIVVISEGFPVGDIGEMKDAFGHTEYSSSKSTVAQVVVNYLNSVGLKARGAARGQVPGTDQRHAMFYASIVDLEEAYRVGQKAVLIARDGENGYMATILRKPGVIYNVYYDKVPLEKVANSEREFPDDWISKNKIDVTDDFIRYARPLIGEDRVSVPIVNGLQRFARFKKIFADKKLSEYIPQEYREALRR